MLTLKYGFDLSSDEEIRGPYPYFINSSCMYQMEISLSGYVEKENAFHASLDSECAPDFAFPHCVPDNI